MILVGLPLSYLTYAQVIKEPEAPPQAKLILHNARELMQNYPVSYAYGGASVVSQTQCVACEECLRRFQKSAHHKPFASCPSCQGCSLDCSHFVQWVFIQSGLEAPYLSTDLMLESSEAVLKKHYHLAIIGTDLNRALPGDLLVYRGHVVLLEALYHNFRGTILHATGGSGGFKGPGQGVQRASNVELSAFRGPLLRILRRLELLPLSQNQAFR